MDTLPALTRAEADLLDHYLRAVDLLARLNPAREAGHRELLGTLHAAQALAAEARALLRTVETMRERGESEVHTETLARAMRFMDGERRMARLRLSPADPTAPDGS
jgi:hypothetical protein